MGQVVFQRRRLTARFQFDLGDTGNEVVRVSQTGLWKVLTRAILYKCTSKLATLGLKTVGFFKERAVSTGLGL